MIIELRLREQSTMLKGQLIMSTSSCATISIITHLSCHGVSIDNRLIANMTSPISVPVEKIYIYTVSGSLFRGTCKKSDHVH
jgi:hypothetical protein